MSLVQLFVPTEVAHDTVAELGELGNVQFKDVSSVKGSVNWLSELTAALSSTQIFHPFNVHSLAKFAVLMRWPVASVSFLLK